MSAAPSPVEVAILHAVSYGDVFDYPLTVEQIHQYLVGVRAPLSTVGRLLEHGNFAPHQLDSRRGFHFLAGRDGIVETRLRRMAVSATAWPLARGYGRLISRLPFIRMVAVSGALTMDNMEADTDIDFFIVTAPGRLWLSRAMVVAVVKLAARSGYVICPNYFLSERQMSLKRRDLFTAHELAQMVPIYGTDVYRRMCQMNSWAADFLPNALGPRCLGEVDDTAGRTSSGDGPLGSWALPKAMAEAALRTPPATWIEEWEMRRKVRKLSGNTRRAASLSSGDPDASGDEVDFSPDRCKGHFDKHGRTTLHAFQERLAGVSRFVPGVTSFPGVAEDYVGEEAETRL